MSQTPPYPPNAYQSVYPGGPAQFDWRKAYGYPPGGPAPRPGILTAIGVISIVVASISLLGSGFTALAGLGMFQMARITTTLSTSSASAYNAPVQGMAANPVKSGAMPAAPGGVPSAGSTGSPQADSGKAPEATGRGMGRTDRATVLAALASIEEMTDGQKRELDAILSQQGLDFFPQAADTSDKVSAGATPLALSRYDVTAAVTAHGTMPTPDANEGDPVYFKTEQGRLELHDDRAIFRFTDPTAPAVRTTAAAVEANAPPPPLPAGSTDSQQGSSPQAGSGPPTPGPAASNDPFAPPAQSDPFANPDSAATQPAIAVKPAGSGLSPSQIATVVQKAQVASGNKMNPAQLATLGAALAKPDQQLVTPTTLWSPVSLAIPQPDGSVVLKMNGGFLVIDAQGTVSEQMATGMPKLRMNPMPIALVIAESVASLALAVFLLVSGIFLLKDSPRGRRLHQIFALIKIPLAVIAIAGFSWMMTDLAGNMRRLPGASGPSDGFEIFGIVIAAAGLIYPVVLLITMHAKSVRDYYRTIKTSDWDV